MNEEIKELISEYKKYKAFLKVDESLKKQGVWGFISTENLPSVIEFVKTFEDKFLDIKDDRTK